LILKKAFDTINKKKKKLLESLASFGIPKKIERFVKLTLEGAQGNVIVDGKISNPFSKELGVLIVTVEYSCVRL